MWKDTLQVASTAWLLGVQKGLDGTKAQRRANTQSQRERMCGDPITDYTEVKVCN